MINDGGRAFPNDFERELGMSLRDYFAAKAMQAMLSDTTCILTRESIAREAYLLADFMIKERRIANE